ncbi:hypothetical protein [Streptomyces sp. NPDC029004]|uniref:hypothetical protein n=1 Tax=Streptomyces sp. NPDC029004 TaxID=3154490 RepID=UPI00340EC47D
MAIRAILLSKDSLDPRGIRLQGARVTGQLDLTDVRSAVPLKLEKCRFDEPVVLERAQLSTVSLRGSHLSGLQADGLHVDGDLSLKGLRATGTDQESVVRLRGAHITGRLWMEGVVINNATGSAFFADDLKVDGTAFLDRLQATCDSKHGAVQLIGARIAGQLVMTNCRLTNYGGPALHADALRVENMTGMDDLRAIGEGESGAVRLSEAHITGQLSLSQAKLYNSSGPAFQADGLRVNALVSLDGLKATGHHEDGAVRLMHASISGQLNLLGAVLVSDRGPGLAGDGLRVGGSTVIGGLQAEGAGEDGAVRLSGAHLSGKLSTRGSEKAVRLTNKGNGPALRADRLRVDSDVILASVTATGRGELGTLHLPGAHIAGDLTVGGSATNDSGGRIFLDLRHAHVHSQLSLFDQTFWREAFSKQETERPQLLLNGLTYRTPPTASGADIWLEALQKCMPHYSPQPYRQLAESYRNVGAEEQAKKILIAQQEAFHATLHRRRDKAWHRTSDLTVRYGYRPGRALWLLLLLLLAACGVMTIWAEPHGLLVHPGDGSHCGFIETIGEAVTRTLPLLRFAAYGGCKLTDSGGAQAVYAVMLILQALSWALLTLFVAGFTGIIRKPSS